MLTDRRMRSRAEIGDIASLVRRLGEVHDDPRLLELAASLEHAADSEQPGAAFARAFRVPRYRRSPAKIERDKAYAAMVTCPRYDGLVAKQRFQRIAEDLANYATGAAWRADRNRPDCPYPPGSWQAWAWQALMVDGRIPNPKTVKRAFSQHQGQNSFVPASGSLSQ